jgi:ribonucleoside-diphosphate reductase alpha chain|tara:strand:+ start:6477 stop:8198 length:1722 start_codon:yes stop_codon:yes gene_type:complete
MEPVTEYGPTVPSCNDLHASKYRLSNESFEECMARISLHMSDDEEHFKSLKEILLNMRFMPAGRIQSAMGSPRDVTAYNCFVSGSIEDSMQSIMEKATQAAETMRRGGGIGYDFSNIRPSGDRIVSLDSSASGPVSFMHIYDAICRTIVSAGHRRGAMMGVLRVDHPDIEEFIRAKRNTTDLTNFNISIGVTDEFMNAVTNKTEFALRFDGKDYKHIDASALWDEIMRANWDWAEPGVLFIDRINEENPLYYCEEITATNPCGEQPLPPFGACLLGSFNLVKYVSPQRVGSNIKFRFNFFQFEQDIPVVVNAMDNVIDRTNYPLSEQKEEAESKRRMGLGITGLGNALTLMDMKYGEPNTLKFIRKLMRTLTYESYHASSDRAVMHGSFPLFDKDKYLDGKFISRFPEALKEKIKKQGMRNSHLISIAPTGTISFCADNISSGLEPVFSHELTRTVNTEFGPINILLKDYVYSNHKIKGETTEDLTTDSHLNTQIACQPYVDSAISKTINVGENVTFLEFKDIYTKAWKGKLKGVTTFRLSGKRYGILNKVESSETEGTACYFDPDTGQKECA